MFLCIHVHAMWLVSVRVCIWLNQEGLERVVRMCVLNWSKQRLKWMQHVLHKIEEMFWLKSEDRYVIYSRGEGEVDRLNYKELQCTGTRDTLSVSKKRKKSNFFNMVCFRVCFLVLTTLTLLQQGFCFTSNSLIHSHRESGYTWNSLYIREWCISIFFIW